MADETASDVTVKDKNACRNPPCTCPVERGEKFCSVHCQSTEHNVQIDCDCGHDTCKGDF